MAEYIEREAAVKAANEWVSEAIACPWCGAKMDGNANG